jgi:hypothetical protein
MFPTLTTFSAARPDGANMMTARKAVVAKTMPAFFQMLNVLCMVDYLL